ncbi:MAG TPA: DeoR/GlpR family DNA-binding transcription regulator [Spirochaetia bacterium]|nr:DeoR/GlpR family DNA-binding transcription regulator [Spirochaetia bacterium]
MIEKLTEREEAIIELLTEDFSASVQEMSRRLEVSTVTVRSDLSSLAEKGILVRTHGGAFPAFHQSILDRQRDKVKIKERIGRAASQLVHDGDAIMIEAGTTTAQVARYLLGRRDLHVVTNSTLVIPFARFNPGIHLTVVGGEFRPSTESLVGPGALSDLEEFHVGTAFIGTDGFSLESGLTTHLVEGAEIVRKMAGQAERTVLVADSSKFGRVGFARVLPLASIHILITDDGLPGDVRERLAEMSVEVIVA